MRTLYTNGKVVTMDTSLPQAEALVIENNIILGIGTVEEMTALAGDSAKVVDMDGGTLFPGFNETHNHLSMYANFQQDVYLGECQSIDELKEKLQNHLPQCSERYCMGYSYDDTKLSDGRQITRHDLDEVSCDRPVIVFHISAHLGFLNTKALELFNITENTSPPVGGEIHLGADGKPTGRLDELAWFNLISEFPAPDPETFPAMLETAIANFNAQGITGVHDAAIGIEGAPELVLESYKKLADENRLGVRTFLSLMPDVVNSMNPKLPTNPKSDDMVTLGGVKLFIDGSIQAKTAALLRPYHEEESWKSDLVMPEDEFAELVLQYHRDGYHLSIHGNGDAAIEAIISAVEMAQKDTPRPDARHMLIHCQMAHDRHLDRMKEIGMIPSFFIMHVNNWGDRHKELFLGEERASRINPAGSAEKRRIPFTFHVDTPVLQPQVLQSIETAITRKTSGGIVLGEEQCTSQYGAIAAYTSMASLCSHSEKYRGTLSVGKYADMVLLDTNISTCEPEQISQAKVLRTITDGREVYCHLN